MIALLIEFIQVSRKIYPSECRVPKNSQKLFLSEQCKEIEGNNRMENTRDHFKKISATKATFHAKMGTIKDRNHMDLTETEVWQDYTEGPNRSRRWQDYTEELYIKDLHDPDKQDGVITHLEPDTLECEVKWALGSITTNKVSGGDGIPAELLQNPKR